MRIGVNSLLPGAELEIPGLVSVLQELARFDDLDLVVFAGGRSLACLRKALSGLQNVVFVESGTPSGFRFARMFCEPWRLSALVERVGVDVVWSPDKTAPIRSAVPRVISITDMRHRRHPEDFGFGELVRACVLSGLSARTGTAWTVPSEFTRGEMVRFAGIDPAKVLVVPPAADAPSFNRSFSGTFRANRLTALTHSADPYILTVSKTDPRRDVAAAVMAFGRVMTRIPHRLVIVGPPGRDEPSVLAAMNAQISPSRVVRIYRVDKADRAVLYQGADLFVFSSRYEGFGLPVLEAMTSGAPVVAARCAAVTEIAGNAIEYVPPGDVAQFSETMLKMLQWDVRHRQRRIRLARARASGYTWRGTALGILRACELAIASPGERHLRTRSSRRR